MGLLNRQLRQFSGDVLTPRSVVTAKSTSAPDCTSSGTSKVRTYTDRLGRVNAGNSRTVLFTSKVTGFRGGVIAGCSGLLVLMRTPVAVTAVEASDKRAQTLAPLYGILERHIAAVPAL
jgi:hypothetical protein